MRIAIASKQAGLAALALAVVGAIILIEVPNPLLTLVDLVALGVIWWGAVGNPIRSVIAMLLSIQWLQASAKLWIANIMDISLATPSVRLLTASNYLEVTPYTSAAILLALAGIVAVALGIRVLEPKLQLGASDFAPFAPTRLFLFYLPLLLVSQVAGPYFGDSLAQLLVAIGALRWAPVVLLIGGWFHTRRGGLTLAAVCGCEIALGFLGYFAAWKSILILVAIAAIAIAGKEWRRALPMVVGGVVALLVLGTIWTVIKPAYRDALNRGSNEQIITLSPMEQASALSRGVGSVEADEFSEGFIDLFMRISYVDYLADAIQLVPAQIEHQEGRLWGEALQQIAMPRFLFPDKPALPSDSERTMRFTGKVLSTTGTSISIGYVGDSYIDFGAAGALIVCFVMGAAFSLGLFAISKLGRGRKDASLVFALSISFLWPLQVFETSNVKMLGGAVWAWIACALLIVVAWPSLAPLLRAPRPVAPLQGLFPHR